ncbi:ATP-binding protein [Streptomyces chartreusis]|uniref:ATP-binding protein n=1 Tax=Streptomyces chartreusis TaxID=1969 RepID=UPI0034047C28
MNSDSGVTALRSERALPARTFTQQFSSTRRGARLARLLAVNQFEAWGWQHRTETSQTAALLVAELASNAVFHGRVQGRDFRLHLTMDDAPDRMRASAVLRIEVTDPRGEYVPQPHEPAPPASVNAPEAVTEAEGGRGLLLVQALATRWGVRPYPSGKMVWCELEIAPHPR